MRFMELLVSFVLDLDQGLVRNCIDLLNRSLSLKVKRNRALLRSFAPSRVRIVRGLASNYPFRPHNTEGGHVQNFQK